MRLRPAAIVLLLALAAAGCTTPPVEPDVASAWNAQGTTRPRDAAVEARILALDPDNVRESEVRDTLRFGPTPRIMLLHGGIFPVHLAMTSFGNFLVAMGYPEARIRNPRDGSWSHSPYEDVERLAGIAAWYYERDGMPPMLIGHSQGGMQAIKMLHVLNGEYSDQVPVWNPLTDNPEDRTAIRDPLTGREQPVVGLRLGYVSVVGAGGAAFLLPNQWSMAGRLRTIPDTVESFTGYAIAVDLWAWTFPGDPGNQYSNGGQAAVRNVTLPAGYNHVFVPVTDELAADPEARRWIDAYVPGRTPADQPAGTGDNLLWAADVWYSVKKHWVLEAQRYLLARRAGAQPAMTGKLE
jgi:hypothetical protein